MKHLPDRTELRRDERGQGAMGIARLFLALGVGAMVFWIVDLVTAPLFDHARAQNAGEVATNGTTWLGEAVAYLPIVFLIVSFFGLIAYSSVYSREVGTPR